MRKILIIEDDPIISRIYQNKFQTEGFQVEVSPDGESAINWLKQKTPDLVILDLMLPRVNGVEVLAFIRGQPSTKFVPVIVFSNAYMGKLVEAAWKAGATECVVKAECTPKVLVEVVAQALARPAPASASSAPTPSVQPPGDADTLFLLRRREGFAQQLPETFRDVRSRFQTLSRSSPEANQVAALSELYAVIRSLTGNAGFVGLRSLARFSSAVEAYLKVLHEKPKFLTASALRTIANAVDFLGVLCDRPGKVEADFGHLFRILVVDDEVISRRALELSLERVQLKAISLSKPDVALVVLEENRFDLIFLDVQMPGKTGFEVCEQIRALPNNRATPVIFVTGQTDFESRAKLSLSGGNDLIGKPFLPLEVALKALTCLFKESLAKSAEAPEAS